MLGDTRRTGQDVGGSRFSGAADLQQANMPNPRPDIYGHRITLRRTSEEDLSDLMALWNDGRVMSWVGFPDGLGYDLEKMVDWFRSLQADPSRHHFVVYAEGVGFCGEVYYAMDEKHRRASLDIKFRPEAQGQGLATDALNTLIRFVFDSEPDADAVWTEPSEWNAAARSLYERCGLKPKRRPPDMEQGPSYWELWRGHHGTSF
jgi:RimJ/RimL family protein N-acetyltransferase